MTVHTVCRGWVNAVPPWQELVKVIIKIDNNDMAQEFENYRPFHDRSNIRHHLKPKLGTSSYKTCAQTTSSGIMQMN